ncbi:hypothetical protein [Rhizobium sp. AC27/96]|uniref:hypothetical protein n=1 Tax=Rhizobium sp. AC27/96 TaxID=1841653 RepID=UPI001146E44E|nr:hypothetical protein [Rhizobium sp. AC27/96]
MSVRLPHASDMSQDTQLRAILHQWARKLVDADAAADRVVQRTINVVCDSPELLDGGRMNEALFALLRRYAFDENDLSMSRQIKGAGQDAGKPFGKPGGQPE